jgi:hypothetical protein
LPAVTFMAEKAEIADFTKTGVFNLQAEVEYRTKLQDICNKIYAAAELDEILIDLKDEITSLFEAERITVFVLDGKRKELVSRQTKNGQYPECL